jgi:FAD:protein FMN transferase
MSAATASGAPAVHVEHCMGTVFTIDVRDDGVWDEAIGEVVAWLHRVDEVFSTYRPASDVSRIRRGALRVEDADPAVAEVLGLCARAEAETGGYFSAHWNGALDPTGLVKGWAIERAAGILHAHGSRNHAVNGGGDVQIAGEVARGEPWRVGISDPHDVTRLVAIVAGRDFAVATSGTAERGEHIVDPHAAAPAGALAAVTVVGGSLTRVDAYATAAFAMGDAAPAWLEAQAGIEALAVLADGRAVPTAGFYGPCGAAPT